MGAVWKLENQTLQIVCPSSLTDTNIACGSTPEMRRCYFGWKNISFYPALHVGIQMNFMLNMIFFKKITINQTPLSLCYYIFLTLTGNKLTVRTSSFNIGI